MTPIETKQVGKKTLKLFHDDDCSNPRDNGLGSNLGTMLYTSRNHVLGDKRVEPSEIDKIVKRTASDVIGDVFSKGKLTQYIYLEVHAMIHSGVALRTCRPGAGAPFSCPWDSGMCGIIYMSLREVKKWYGGTSPEQIELAYKCMATEVEYFGKWLNGQCYGYTLEDESGTEVDSCWGFIGDTDEVLETITKEIGE